MKKIKMLIVLFFCCFLSYFWPACSREFSVKEHLGTYTRYADALAGQGGHLPLPPPPAGCRPIHLNYLSRHACRSPTWENELDMVAVAAKLSAAAATSPSLPRWALGYKSPWQGLGGAYGYLIPGSEGELFDQAQRMRHRFPTLFREPYNPDFYTILASQIPRASASAMAFGLGLFAEGSKAETGPDNCQNRPFAVVTDTQDMDTRLRFHAICPAYQEHKKAMAPVVGSRQRPVLAAVATGLDKRCGIRLSTEEVYALWTLCRLEASLKNDTEHACSLFSNDEVLLLEWATDESDYVLKGYGAPINYEMGTELMKDVVASMEEAIRASEVGRTLQAGDAASQPRRQERARLRFAHAETLMPFAAMLGLFAESPGAGQQPADLPPPDSPRQWHSSLVAPFSGNEALVLYECSAGGSGSGRGGRRLLETEEGDGEEEAYHEGDELLAGEWCPADGLTCRRQLASGDDGEEGEEEWVEEEEDGYGRWMEDEDAEEAWEAEEDEVEGLEHVERRGWSIDRRRLLAKEEPGAGAASAGATYQVLVLHNERPVSLPACNGRLFCDFTLFRDTIAAPFTCKSFTQVCSKPSATTQTNTDKRRMAPFFQIRRLRWPHLASEPPLPQFPAPGRVLLGEAGDDSAHLAELPPEARSLSEVQRTAEQRRRVFGRKRSGGGAHVSVRYGHPRRRRGAQRGRGPYVDVVQGSGGNGRKPRSGGSSITVQKRRRSGGRPGWAGAEDGESEKRARPLHKAARPVGSEARALQARPEAEVQHRDARRYYVDGHWIGAYSSALDGRRLRSTDTRLLDGIVVIEEEAEGQGGGAVGNGRQDSGDLLVRSLQQASRAVAKMPDRVATWMQVKQDEREDSALQGLVRSLLRIAGGLYSHATAGKETDAGVAAMDTRMQLGGGAEVDEPRSLQEIDGENVERHNESEVERGLDDESGQYEDEEGEGVGERALGGAGTGEGEEAEGMQESEGVAEDVANPVRSRGLMSVLGRGWLKRWVPMGVRERVEFVKLSSEALTKKGP